MSKAHTGLKAKEFEDSSYTVKKYYCKASGNLATAGCPDKAVGWYKKSNVPELCTAHEGEALKDPTKEDLKDTSSSTSSTSSTAQ